MESVRKNLWELTRISEMDERLEMLKQKFERTEMDLKVEVIKNHLKLGKLYVVDGMNNIELINTLLTESTDLAHSISLNLQDSENILKSSVLGILPKHKRLQNLLSLNRELTEFKRIIDDYKHMQTLIDEHKFYEARIMSDRIDKIPRKFACLQWLNSSKLKGNIFISIKQCVEKLSCEFDCALFENILLSYSVDLSSDLVADLIYSDFCKSIPRNSKQAVLSAMKYPVPEKTLSYLIGIIGGTELGTAMFNIIYSMKQLLNNYNSIAEKFELSVAKSLLNSADLEEFEAFRERIRLSLFNKKEVLKEKVVENLKTVLINAKNFFFIDDKEIYNILYEFSSISELDSTLNSRCKDFLDYFQMNYWNNLVELLEIEPWRSLPVTHMSSITNIPINSISNVGKSLIRISGEYINLSKILKPISFEVLMGFTNLVDYFMYSLYFANDSSYSLVTADREDLDKSVKEYIKFKKFNSLYNFMCVTSELIKELSFDPRFDFIESNVRLKGYQETILSIESVFVVIKHFNSIIPLDLLNDADWLFMQTKMKAYKNIAGELRDCLLEKIFEESISLKWLEFAVLSFDWTSETNLHTGYIKELVNLLNLFRQKHDIKKEKYLERLAEFGLKYLVYCYANVVNCSLEGRNQMIAHIQTYVELLRPHAKNIPNYMECMDYLNIWKEDPDTILTWILTYSDWPINMQKSLVLRSPNCKHKNDKQLKKYTKTVEKHYKDLVTHRIF